MFLRNSTPLTDADSLVVGNLLGQQTLTVANYEGSRIIASDEFDISLDGENWSSSVQVDFTPIISVEIQVRPRSSDSGTITVTGA